MAVQLLDQAARLNPTAETLLLLARAEFKNPMWGQRALDHLKHAVALAPEFTEAWLELANFWAIRNMTDRQQQCLEKILEYDPQNVDTGGEEPVGEPLAAGIGFLVAGFKLHHLGQIGFPCHPLLFQRLPQDVDVKAALGHVKRPKLLRKRS